MKATSMWDPWLRYVLRPLGRRLGTNRWEPHVVGMCSCVNCGHRAVVVIPEASPCVDPDTGVIDMVECSECGKHTMCSE